MEVNTESDARTFALSIVELNPNAIRIVPAEELLSVLYIKNPFSFDDRNWAKLTGRGTGWSIYTGDIGMVVTQNSVKTVVVIPRIKTSESIDMLRPQQSLFPAHVLINIFGDDCISSSSSDGSFTFKGRRFTKEGFLRHKLSEVDVYRPADDLPTELELEIFKECSMMDDKILNDAVSRLARIKIVLNDRVVVVEGDFKGLVGTVVERGDNEVAVDVETQDQIERVNLSAVRVAFRLGDQVQIKQGPHSGRIGWIVDVQDLTVTVINVELDLEVIMNSCSIYFVDKFLQASIKKSDIGFYNSPFLTTLRKRTIARDVKFRDDPNKIYHGKRVIVVGGHRYKTYKGYIKNTNIEGYAWVELDALFQNQLEKISLDSLAFLWVLN